MTPFEAFHELVEGNRRFVTAKITQASRRDLIAARLAVRETQSPLAAVIACSNSRVAPEIIFDQGLGALFDVRAAGNVIDAFGRGSLEYAVHHLHVPLVIVIGHEHCGAVTAAVDHSEEPGDIATIIKAIEPAVEATAKELPGHLTGHSSGQGQRDQCYGIA